MTCGHPARAWLSQTVSLQGPDPSSAHRPEAVKTKRIARLGSIECLIPFIVSDSSRLKLRNSRRRSGFPARLVCQAGKPDLQRVPANRLFVPWIERELLVGQA